MLFRILIFVSIGASLSAETFRVATYNVRNYLIMDRVVEGQWRPDYPKPEKEKAAIREVIREASPDILVLQEMGPAPFLDELRADLLREGLEYSYAMHMEAADKVRHLAVLSKVAPIEVVQHVDLDFKYFEGRGLVKRGLLELSFQVDNGRAFQLFAVHLKSRFSDLESDPHSQMRRTREAEACRNRIIEQTLDVGRSDYLVVGDFNDHPASGTLRRFYAKGDLVLGELVNALDTRGEYWTYFYAKGKRYESIDGFVASPTLLPSINNVSATIVDSPGALIASDYRLVYLDLEVGSD